MLDEPLDEVVSSLLGHLLVEVKDNDGIRARLGEGTRDQVAELVRRRERPRETGQNVSDFAPSSKFLSHMSSDETVDPENE